MASDPSGFLNIQDYGPDPVDGTWDAALALLINQTSTPLIIMPGDAGYYRFRSDTLPKRHPSQPPVRVRGEGGTPRRAVTKLLFENGAKILADAPATRGDWNAPNGGNTIFEDLSITCGVQVPNSLTAIEIRAPWFQLRRCSLYDWHRCIEVNGEGSAGYNANNFRFDDVWVEDSRDFCVWTHGADSSGGIATVRCHTSAGGIYDSTFVRGNLWLSCEVESSTPSLPAYRCDGAPSTFINCGEERSMTGIPCEIGEPAIWLGPMPPNGIVAPAGRPISSHITGTGTRGGFTAYNANATRNVRASMCEPQDARAVFTMQDLSPAPNAPSGDKDDLSWRFEDGDLLALERNRSLLRAIIAVTRERNTLLGADQCIIPNGVHFGIGRGMHHDYAAIQPLDTQGYNGDIRWATAPSSTLAGWVKESGHWRPFVLASPPPPPEQ